MKKNTYEIRYKDRKGVERWEKGVINDEPAAEFLKKHASEYPEPHVVFFNGKLTNF